jgi:hypothetical protein
LTERDFCSSRVPAAVGWCRAHCTEREETSYRDEASYRRVKAKPHFAHTHASTLSPSRHRPFSLSSSSHALPLPTKRQPTRSGREKKSLGESSSPPPLFAQLGAEIRPPPPPRPCPEVSAPARRSVPQRPLARRFRLSTYLPFLCRRELVGTREWRFWCWPSGGVGAEFGAPPREVLLGSGGAVGVSRGFRCRPSSVVSGGAPAMRFPGRILRISVPKCGCSTFFFSGFFRLEIEIHHKRPSRFVTGALASIHPRV